MFCYCHCSAVYDIQHCNDSNRVRSRNCGCLVTRFCYQLIAKPGNMTAAVSWADPTKHKPGFNYYDIKIYCTTLWQHHTISDFEQETSHALQWHHMSIMVSQNDWQLGNSLFRLTTKKHSKLGITGREFTSNQWISSTKGPASILISFWHHHDLTVTREAL